MRPLFHQLRRSEAGFTLMELTVTMAIISILCVIGASLFTALFDSQIRQSQMLDQSTTIESYFGFMAARLSPAQRPIGLIRNDGTIDRRSIANDQFVFQSSGLCYRVFWMGPDVPNRAETTENQILAAVAPDCNSPKITPVRGPNEPPADDSNGDGFAEPDDADFDIAIDSLAPNWCIIEGSGICNEASLCKQAETGDLTDACVWQPAQLAAGIVKEKPPYAPAGTPAELVPFRFLSDGNIDISGMSQQAGVGPAGSFYDSVSHAAAIASIDATAYIHAMPGAGPNVARVSDRYYQQNFSLQQVCVVGDISGIELGALGGDISGNTNSAVVNQGAINSGKVADDSLTSNDLAAGAANTSELANDAVTSAKVADDSLTASDLRGYGSQVLTHTDSGQTDFTTPGLWMVEARYSGIPIGSALVSITTATSGSGVRYVGILASHKGWSHAGNGIFFEAIDSGTTNGVFRVRTTGSTGNPIRITFTRVTENF